MTASPDSSPAAQGLQQRVFDAMREGRTADARTLCEAQIAENGGDGEAWFALGRVAMQERAYGDAVHAFERALELGTNPWAHVYRALSLWELDEFDAALAQARKAVEMAPDFAEGHSALASILHGLNRSLEAEAHARAGERLNPGSHFVAGKLASILAHLGQLEEAEVLFRRAAKLAPGLPHYGTISFCRPLWDRIGNESPDGPTVPQMVYEKGEMGEGGAVVLACCDSLYLRKYGASFINSFARHAAGNSLLHLHVFDPDGGLRDYVSWLTSRIDLSCFRVTTERSPLDKGAGGATRRTYYSCGRFLQMSRLLADYGRPIVCFDIDATLQAPVQQLIEHAHGRDLGLILREPADSPWLDVVANIVVANPTPLSARYFQLVRNYILYYLHRGKLYWHLDQIALYCVIKMMTRYAEVPDIAWIRAGLRDASLWHIGQSYGHKMLDERYSRFALGGPEAQDGSPPAMDLPRGIMEP